MISGGNLENDPILQENLLASDSEINANSQRVSKKIYKKTITKQICIVCCKKLFIWIPEKPKR